MLTSNSLRWLVVVAGAAMLLAVVAACGTETVEIPGETVVVEKVVTETVEVPGETVVVEKEVIKTVEVPGETVTKEVVKEVMVPGETVVVEKEVVKTVEVPGQTVVKEVVKEVQVPGETVVVEKEVVKTVEVPGQTVVVEKVVVREVPGKTYVTDPTTGKVVTAPEYGGTFNGAVGPYEFNFDSWWAGAGALGGVVEKLGQTNWGIDRDEFDFVLFTPLSAITGQLAESWSQPDPLTYVFKIRQGVNWHNKPPMNGRELTAKDIEYNFHRVTGLGKFSEAGPSPMGEWSKLPFESITATDKWTVVFKLKEPKLGVLKLILSDYFVFILPPEVIEEHGDVKDWRNVVGTGPYELTDLVVGSSLTYTKNPNYWGYDEKYPENRLPYIDELRFPSMPDSATQMAAMRTGKVDYRGSGGGGTEIRILDDAQSLKRTNPEIALWPWAIRSFHSFSFDVRQPPFDDINVRHAMQMALDLETINVTYFKGLGLVTPEGMEGNLGWRIPFEEWPEEIKKTYRYDPAGAEALLDAAGYPRGADGIRFKTVLNDFALQDLGYVEIAIEYWKAIGVDVEEILRLEPPAWVAAIIEHSYEGILRSFQGAKFDPLTMVTWGRSDNPGFGNFPGWQDPKLDAMIEAAVAAETVEEQKRLVKAVDMYQIENRWHVWGPKVGAFFASQPWLKGYNGEFGLGGIENGAFGHLFSRLWLDLELKAAMGR